jgi:hypothetical protein
MVMLSVIMLNVIVLSVMAPLMELDYHQWPMLWTIYGRNQNDYLILKMGKAANIFMVVIGRKLFITLTLLQVTFARAPCSVLYFVLGASVRLRACAKKLFSVVINLQCLYFKLR